MKYEMKHETKVKLRNLFRPKPGSVVLYDNAVGEYLCWITHIARKVETRKSSTEKNWPRPMRIDRRFVVGYMCVKGQKDVIHTVGEKGILKEKISDSHSMDFFLIRRPVLGSFVVVGLLALGAGMWSIDKVREKFSLAPWFDI